MINLLILIDQPDTLLSAGYTAVRVYSDTSAGGTFTTLLGSTPIISGQQSAQFLDLTGTSATWYKTVYYGTTPGEGTKSAAFQGATSTSYASVLELRSQSDKTLNTEDVNIQLALDAAKYAIDNYTGHPFGFVASTTPTTKIYPGNSRTYLLIDECTSISLVEVKTSPTDPLYTAWASSDWIACSGDPDYPEYNDLPYDMIVVSGTGALNFYSGLGNYLWRDIRDDHYLYNRLPTVRVTATWGYSNVCPSAVKLATMAQATRWLKRGESAWADTLASQDFAMLQFRKALDPDIQMMLVNARLVKPSIGRR